MPTQPELTGETEHAEETRPQRSRFRTKRGWQLAILGQMNLPKKQRSSDNRPVKPAELKSLYHTIDNRAGETGWCMLGIEDEKDDLGNVVRRGLASEAQLSLRTCKRVLEVALALGHVERPDEPIRLRNGGERWNHRLVFQELARTTKLPLWSDSPGPECPNTDNRVPDHQPASARSSASKCPNIDNRVPGSQLASAHAGTHKAPLPAFESPHQPPPTADDWAAAVAEVGKNFSIAKELADRYRENGRTPADLVRNAEDAIATAELTANSRLWSKGPLSAAATFLRTNRWPADGVVTLQQHAESQRDQSQKAERRRAAAAASEQRQAREAEQNARHEAKYGPLVDALDDAAIDELLPRLNSFACDRIRRNRERPWSDSLRDLLILELARLDRSASPAGDGQPRPHESDDKPP